MAVYTCRQGHVYESPTGGFTMSINYFEAAGQAKSTTPLCLVCYLGWLEETFPAWVLIPDDVIEKRHG